MTTIYLSGCDTRRDIDPAYKVGHRNLLTTFAHHGRHEKTNAIKGWQKEFPGLRLFVDSGGFSLRDDPTILQTTGWTIEEYADHYLQFLYDNEKYIHIAANLDLYETEPKLARQFDKKLEQFEIDTGCLVCYVFHPCLGVGEFERMCQRHRLVGVARDTLESPACNLSSMLAVARRLGALVHGFGITEADVLTKELFYSVDSTTWKSGARYGNVSVFNGDKIITHDINNLAKIIPHRDDLKRRGVDWPLIEAHLDGQRDKEITRELLALHAAAWMDYQDHIFNLMQARSWWLKVNNIGKDIIPLKAGYNELKAWCDSINYPYLSDTHDKLKQEVALVIALARFDVQALDDFDPIEILHFAQAHLPAEVDGLSDDWQIFNCIRTAMLELFVPLESVKPQERPSDDTPAIERPKERQPAELAALDEESKNKEAQQLQHEQEEQEKQQEESDPYAEPTENNEDDCPRFIIEKPQMIEDLEDETLRHRAGLLFDAMIRINKAKRTIRVLSLKRATDAIRKRKTVCKGTIAAAREEVNFLKKRLPPGFYKKLAKYIEEKTKQDPLNKEGEPKRGNPDNLPAKRGAPKGNKNALKHGLYSKKAPGLACDQCPIASTCYMHRPGHVCAFDKDFRIEKITTPEEAQDLLRRLAEEDVSRLQKALLFETAKGQVSEPVTKHLAQVFDRINKLKETMLLDQQDADHERNMTITETRKVTGPMAMLSQMFQQAAQQKTETSTDETDDERQRIIEAERIE